MSSFDLVFWDLQYLLLRYTHTLLIRNCSLLLFLKLLLLLLLYLILSLWLLLMTNVIIIRNNSCCGNNWCLLLVTNDIVVNINLNITSLLWLLSSLWLLRSHHHWYSLSKLFSLWVLLSWRLLLLLVSQLLVRISWSQGVTGRFLLFRLSA